MPRTFASGVLNIRRRSAWNGSTAFGIGPKEGLRFSPTSNTRTTRTHLRLRWSSRRGWSLLDDLAVQTHSQFKPIDACGNGKAHDKQGPRAWFRFCELRVLGTVELRGL